MAEGKGSGHQADYYDVRDQRFLGDERFVEQIDERIRAEREIEVPGPRAKFSELLRLTAEAYGMTERELVQPGRQRKLVKPRSMLVYMAREWGRVSVKDLGRRLHRDPSIISRLYSAYAAARDQKKEAVLAKQLRQ
jgi:chromosomal replication initiation ATPase DnaA